MKNPSKILAILFATLIGSMVIFAQEYDITQYPIFHTPPQLAGLPGVAVARLDEGGWTLKIPQGQVFIFDIDKLPALRLLLNPLGQLTPHQFLELDRLSLAPGEAVPGEFLVFPYIKGRSARLYSCLMSFHSNRIFCNIVGLPTVPLPFRQRLYQTSPPSFSY